MFIIILPKNMNSTKTMENFLRSIKHNKPPNFLIGGGTGIRTLGPLLAVMRSPGAPIKPLSHPSKIV